MKRGQFWYNDFIVGFSILAIIGLLFVISMIDINSRNENIDDTFDEAISISNSLMGPGYLMDQWPTGNGRIGIMNNSKVNLNKLAVCMALPYPEAKMLLGSKKDFVFYFEDKSGNIFTEYGINGYIGNPSISSLDDIDAENIVRFTRFVYLDNDFDDKGEIVKMVVVVWE